MHKLLHALEHAFEHTLPEFLRLLPFLFLTYLLMEWLSLAAGARVRDRLSRAGRLGPLLGGALGAIPQCGFSAAAAGLYAGRIISLGTLFAVFLSTSDEMLPILISSRVPLPTVLSVIGLKAGIGMLLGFSVDLLWRRSLQKQEKTPSRDALEDAPGCTCGCCGEAKSKRLILLRLLIGALRHTVTIALFIFLVMLGLDLLIHTVGEDALATVLTGRGFLSHIAAATVALIPNCAASVVITELWVSGAIPFGAMLSGLLVSAGVGLLVLFRTNRPMRQNFAIAALLFAMSIGVGILCDLSGLSGLLS